MKTFVKVVERTTAITMGIIIGVNATDILGNAIGTIAKKFGKNEEAKEIEETEKVTEE